eukprot:CAMPEP_0174867570 /NCGR_PEP_ID=MMETSP1114-20130205/64272_1 /TAXON_ID=312471 /ORGANISM="Neobodo designis, Strain CCAP 1951/1" /LENGTH=58 /DNA_ID=CAMNT_0016102767 /DNA_START=55 /DNA_END=228 /DNA_ORIENTATION=-
MPKLRVTRCTHPRSTGSFSTAARSTGESYLSDSAHIIAHVYSRSVARSSPLRALNFIA